MDFNQVLILVVIVAVVFICLPVLRSLLVGLLILIGTIIFAICRAIYNVIAFVISGIDKFLFKRGL